MIKVYFDGLCEPVNPGGIGCFGAFIINTESLDLTKIKGFAGNGKFMSNNVAEYAALQAALESLINQGLHVEPNIIEIMGDSQLVINQMNGTWKVNTGLYVNACYKAKETLRKFTAKIKFFWIPRAQNEAADGLSRKAYEEHCAINGIPARYMNKSNNFENPSQTTVPGSNSVPAGDTCETCKWLKYNGPHAGCYPNGMWRKWLPKTFIKVDKCEKYEKNKTD